MATSSIPQPLTSGVSPVFGKVVRLLSALIILSGCSGLSGLSGCSGVFGGTGTFGISGFFVFSFVTVTFSASVLILNLTGVASKI